VDFGNTQSKSTAHHTPLLRYQKLKGSRLKGPHLQILGSNRALCPAGHQSLPSCFHWSLRCALLINLSPLSQLITFFLRVSTLPC